MAFSFGQLPTESMPDSTGFTYETGKYETVITNCEEKTSKNGGIYIEFSHEFVGGTYSGKKFTSRVNVVNENKQATEIGLARLKELNIALGIAITQNPEQYINKNVVIDIVKRKNKNTGNDENQLNHFEKSSLGGSVAPGVAAPSTPSNGMVKPPSRPF